MIPCKDRGKQASDNTLVVVGRNFRLSFTKSIEKNKVFVVPSLQLGFNAIQMLFSARPL